MLIDCFYLLGKAATAAVEGKMSKTLKKMLKKIASKDMHEELAVADAKLGGLIKVLIFHLLSGMGLFRLTVTQLAIHQLTSCDCSCVMGIIPVESSQILTISAVKMFEAQLGSIISLKLSHQVCQH